MRACLARLASGPWLPIVLAGLVLASADTARAADGQKHVLALYSLRQDAELSIAGDRELPRILEAGVPEGVDFHSEYIDLARFPDPEYKAAFRDFLALKYRGQRLDLVLAILDNACQFVEENRNALFPESPVVFLTLNRTPPHVPNSTVVLSRLDLARTISFATALQPDTRQVFVVSGASAGDKTYERLAHTQLQPFESRLAFTYLSGLPSKELAQRVATLPEHSVIYYLIVNQDGAGETVHPLEYVDRLAAVANAPIYSWVDSAMGHGILGGSLMQVDAQVEALAERSLRVLRGESAADIPAAAPDLNLDQIDWRQLQRWDISEARVPTGTPIRFREPGMWERYRFLILGATTLVAAQALLIAGLLVQKTRRRQAEKNLLRNQADLLATHDRIRDLGGRLLFAQEAERSRIARELHDDISQQVALLAIDLELLGAGRRPASRDVQRLVAEALARVQGIARSVHDLSHRLHPAKLQLIGLVPALAGLQRELSQSGLAITFKHEAVPAELPPDLTVSLFRVVQEALHNAIRYSRAHEVSVQLRGGAESLTLTVTDDGVGFDVETAWGSGLGLISMSERLEAVGGSLDIRSRPGAGTRLQVTVPRKAARESRMVAV